MKTRKRIWTMIFCFLLCVMLSYTGVSAQEQKTNHVNKLNVNMRKNIYREYSKLIIKKDTYGNHYVYFACEDINGDNIPELFIQRYYRGKKYEKNYDTNGYDIYTYKNGKAKKISEIHGGQSIIKYRKNMLVCRNCDIVSVYKWEKNHYVRKGHYLFSSKKAKEYAKASNKYVGELVQRYSSESKTQQLICLKNLLKIS